MPCISYSAWQGLYLLRQITSQHQDKRRDQFLPQEPGCSAADNLQQLIFPFHFQFFLLRGPHREHLQGQNQPYFMERILTHCGEKISQKGAQDFGEVLGAIRSLSGTNHECDLECRAMGQNVFLCVFFPLLAPSLSGGHLSQSQPLFMRKKAWLPWISQSPSFQESSWEFQFI